jgi:tetratricopeptide (TPR) repeat protein
LNQSTNDDSVIESNMNYVVEQWDNFINKKCSAKSKETVHFVVLARYFRAEAHKLILDRGGETFAAFAAENDLEKVIDAAPRFAYAYELLAQIYNQKGEPSKALDILTRGIDQDKLSKLDKCILLLARGFHFAYEEADSNRALVDYREAVKLDPSCANKIPKKLREKL